MSLSLTQTKTALAIQNIAYFLGVGGTEPYVYSVVADGAGGTINASTGLYTAPNVVQEDVRKLYDTVMVTDDDGATATARILVGDPLLLFCEIIQRELGLAEGRVFIWDQKIFQPSDTSLYVVVAVPVCRPFANTIAPDPVTGWADAVQSVNMQAMLDISLISRGPSAFRRKEELIMALNSLYSQFQQEANSFYIAKVPPGTRFVNLSNVDGAAIPYRYTISINMQYMVRKIKAADYFDTFETIEVVANP